MPSHTVLAMSLGVLIWIVVGSITLEIGACVDDEPVTSGDILFAFTVEPLIIFVGLIVFGLIFIGCYVSCPKFL